MGRFRGRQILGNRVPVRFFKKFSIFFNLTCSRKPNLLLARSSGTYCSCLQVLKEYNLVKVRLPSGGSYMISGDSMATLGRNSNIYKKYQVLGSSKWLYIAGKKPIVRGVAMNPVDHPHGGRTKTNSPEVSIWGWVAKISR